MTFEEIIYDVMEIKGALEDDTELEEMWVLYKINQYRGIHIAMDYALTHEINPVWLQRVHRFVFSRANASDDPAITYNSITVAKATLPRVVSLPEDLGVYRVSGSAGILQYEPCDFNRLMMKAEIGEEGFKQYGYYAKVGDVVYAHPYVMEGAAMIIAENPLDVQINDAGTLRDMTLADNYPLDAKLAQRCILDFLTKDMALSENSVIDILNDSQSRFKVLKNVQSRQVQND